MYGQTIIEVSIINFCILCMEQKILRERSKKHSVKCSHATHTVEGGEIALEKAGFPTKPVFPCRHLTWAHLIQAFSRNRQALLTRGRRYTVKVRV
jgi:hypothetical protein